MGERMVYVGSYWVGNPCLLETEEAVLYCLQKLYYLYKDRLEEHIRLLPYYDLRLNRLYQAYSNMYKNRKQKITAFSEYPITKEELEGRFKYYFYDDVLFRLVECQQEIEDDRYYFINYCKKRSYQVSEDFYDCVLQDGEVVLSKIAPQFREILPIDFVKKRSLTIVS